MPSLPWPPAAPAPCPVPDVNTKQLVLIEKCESLESLKKEKEDYEFDVFYLTIQAGDPFPT